MTHFLVKRIGKIFGILLGTFVGLSIYFLLLTGTQEDFGYTPGYIVVEVIGKSIIFLIINSLSLFFSKNK